MYMIRNEVGRQTIYVISFQTSCTVLTLQLVIITCFSTSRNIRPPTQSLRSDQETKRIVQDWLKGLAKTVFYEGVQTLVP